MGQSIKAKPSKEIAQHSLERKLDAASVELMRDIFMRVCETLKLSDPADPLSAEIARTVITIALDGQYDRVGLYKQTLSRH